MATRIICPFHADGKERTPSLMLYPDGYMCFACGANGPLSELDPNAVPKVIEAVKPEDLVASYKYIDSLPLIDVRGLKLPADDEGFYIPWPNRAYYKKRIFEPGDGPKYLGSAGHTRPLFWARKSNNPILILVEGELNALSLAKAVSNMNVASPGGAGDFSSKRIRRLLTTENICSTVLVIADRDKAGTEAVINAVSELRASGREALGILMQEDANSLLERFGSGGLRQRVLEQIERAVAAGSASRKV